VRTPAKIGSSAPHEGTVVVAGEKITFDSDTGRALIDDSARYTEGLLTDEDLRGVWRMSRSELVALKNDAQLIEAVRNAMCRRAQDGSAAREAARKAFLKAPRILEQILDDPLTPVRGKIEASRELRAAADFPSNQTSSSGEIFSIVIDLGAAGAETLRYSGQLHPNQSRNSNTIDALPFAPSTEHGSEENE
jgi:hypothetical protein